MGSESLGDQFPKMQARIRKCRDRGVQMGAAGAFYVMVCDDLLRRADEAAVRGDAVEMIRVFQEMQDLKE